MHTTIASHFTTDPIPYKHNKKQNQYLVTFCVVRHHPTAGNESGEKFWTDNVSSCLQDYCNNNDSVHLKH